MALTLDTVGAFILQLVLMVLGIIFILGTATGAFFWVKFAKRYNQFKCIIWERDGFGQLKESYDKAGIFVDAKTKNKRLFLKKNKVGLNPDKLPYLVGEQKKRTVKTIYLLKTGLKNFHYIDIGVKEPAVTLTVGEEDVNWGINSYERQKKLFKDSILIQLLPFITIAFVTIIILILFIYLFKNLSTFGTAAEELKEAALAIAQARTGTVVLPS